MTSTPTTYLFEYTRVSTDTQDEGSQKYAIAAWITSLPDHAISERFMDHGMSGANNDREQLSNMLALLNEVDGVICYDETRLTRDFEKGMQILFQFKRLGKKLYFAARREIVTLKDDNEVLIYTIKFWSADLERKKINDRIKSGIANAKNNGVHCGRPFTPINWKIYDKTYELLHNKSATLRCLGIPLSTGFRLIKNREKN